MQDTVAVALKVGAVRTLILMLFAVCHFLIDTCAGIIAENTEFSNLILFSDSQNYPP